MTVYENLGDTIDQQIRVVHIGDDINVAVGVLRRGVTNGQTQTVSAGDVVVIPAGVPHGFLHIQEQITYLSIRVDPDQVLPTGYVHPSLEK